MSSSRKSSAEKIKINSFDDLFGGTPQEQGGATANVEEVKTEEVTETSKQDEENKKQAKPKSKLKSKPAKKVDLPPQEEEPADEEEMGETEIEDVSGKERVCYYWDKALSRQIEKNAIMEGKSTSLFVAELVAKGLNYELIEQYDNLVASNPAFKAILAKTSRARAKK